MMIIFSILLSACGLLACEHGDTVVMDVLSPEGWQYDVPIDRCLAPIIKALNDAGIVTVSSCCNHGRESYEVPGSFGYIQLADRLILISGPKEDAEMLYFKICEPMARYWRDRQVFSPDVNN